MNVVMADVQADALQQAAAEIESLGARVLAQRVDVSKAAEVESLGAATLARFGAPAMVFNNAGVGAGGLIWESSAADWEWVLGVNLMGVAHGIRVFTPMMLDAAERDPAYEGHIVNTASMAGLLNMPNMGIYNASKHAVVSMSETLYQDLRLVTDRIGASVLCPFFVPTGITHSERNRPGDLPPEGADAQPADRRAMTDRAVGRGKVSACRRRRLRVRRHRGRALLHLQPPEIARHRADAARGRRPVAQPDRPVRRAAGDRCRTAFGAPGEGLAAELQGLHRPAAVGIHDDQVDLARMGRVGRAGEVEGQRCGARRRSARQRRCGSRARRSRGAGCCPGSRPP